MKPYINRVMKTIEGLPVAAPKNGCRTLLKGPLFVLFICTSYIFMYQLYVVGVCTIYMY